MIYKFRTLIWLCWILFSLLSFVEGQFGGGGFGGGSFGPPVGVGSGKKPFGNGVGFRGGGSFAGGNSGSNKFGQMTGNGPDGFGGGGNGERQGEQQGEQMAEDDDPSSSMPSADPVMSLPSSAVPAMAEEGEEPAPTANIVLPAPTSATEVEQPSSIANALPEPTTTFAAPPGIPLVLPTSMIPSDAVLPTAAFEQNPSSALNRPTVTTSMTLWITPSPVAETFVASAEEASSTTEASSSSTVEVAPLSTSSGTTMSASKQAGMGIGITFGLLSVAGATSLYLWRRRRNRRIGRDNTTHSGRKFDLGGFLRLRSRSNTDPKNDPEWSIESASKVEILRGGSAKSIRTGSRSDSPPSPTHFPGTDEQPFRFPKAAVVGESRKMGGGVGLEVLRVGMRVPDRKPNLALTSNPPVSPSEFPTPPSSRGNEFRGGEKARNWPLST